MKTKEITNKRKGLTLFLLTCLVMNFSLHAQVTIGGLQEPAKGAILDLNTTVKGGLVLSNVNLVNLHSIPAGFPVADGISFEDSDVKTAFIGAMVYHTGGSAIPPGVYIWNGTNWTPMGEDCRPLSSLALTVPNPVFEGRNVFSVSSGASDRCAENEEYVWEVSGNYDSNFANLSTTAYPESSVPVNFSAPGTWKVRVKATNHYSASPEVTETLTVNVLPFSYYLYLNGKTCYDINQNADSRNIATTADARVAMSTDFSVPANQKQTYRIHYNAPYSGLVVSLKDDDAIVTSHTQPGNYMNGVDTFSVVFNGTKGTATLKAAYTDRNGNLKEAVMDVTVQDALCGCPARLTFSGNDASDWLVFQCHNLGGKDILSSSQAQSMDIEHHGNWYRWGARNVSVVNDDGVSTGSLAGNGWGCCASTAAYPYQDQGTDNWYEYNNPCPAGWRLPTSNEWMNVAIAGNNTVVFGGDWSSAGSEYTKFSAYMQVGDYLFLPAAGLRVGASGALSERGYSGRYWSSTKGSISYEYGRYMFFYYGENPYQDDGYRAIGISVRCVAVE
jgi:uncharacterized protein (TIGR02145 family)